jgi:glyoxylase-like metal-dependent hydrolase (beta-lactamase superfamily II)
VSRYELAVAPGVHRFGDRVANWYLIDEAGELTLVDAGFPSDWERLRGAVSAIGRSLDAIRAVVLTHAHDDHIGMAQRVSEELQAPVSIHAGDADRARRAHGGGRPNILPYLWRPRTWIFLVHFVSRRGPWPRAITSPVPFTDDRPLDVPGNPVPIHTPGHTAGHCALHIPERGVLFTGDALVTRNVLTGGTGPQLSPGPFNEDTAEARRSLELLAPLAADVLLPGHGAPFRGHPSRAVDRALDRS